MKKVDVTIQTLNVTIKSLVLNNKRFTKSVFWQLPNLDFWRIQYDEGEVLSNIKLENCIGFVKVDYVNYYLLVLKDGCLHKYPFLIDGNLRFDRCIFKKDLHKLLISSQENEGTHECEILRFKYEFVDFIENPANQIFIAL